MLPVNTACTCDISGQSPEFPRKKEDRVTVKKKTERTYADFLAASRISSIESGDLRGFWQHTLCPVGFSLEAAHTWLPVNFKGSLTDMLHGEYLPTD